MPNTKHGRARKAGASGSNMMHLLGGDTDANLLSFEQINNDFLRRLNANTDDEEDEKFNFNMSKDPNILKMDEADLTRLKDCYLFKEWNEQTFKNFVDDNRIYLKKFKYGLSFTIRIKTKFRRILLT